MQVHSYERINILLPKETAQELKRAVPRGKRSQFVTRAIQAQIVEEKKDMYKELLKIRKNGPEVSMEEVVEWIREDRASH